MQIGQELPVLLPGACFTGAVFPIASAHGVGISVIVMAGMELPFATGAAHDGPPALKNTPSATTKAATCRMGTQANIP